jgi:hypothetical protein
MYTRTFIEFIRTHRLENANDMVSMSNWTITHVNGLVSPTHRGRNRGERGTLQHPWSMVLFPSKRETCRQHVDFAAIRYFGSKTRSVGSTDSGCTAICTGDTETPGFGDMKASEASWRGTLSNESWQGKLARYINYWKIQRLARKSRHAIIIHRFNGSFTRFGSLSIS